MIKPSISVIIPVYNKGEYVQRALRSILNQTYQDFEIVVVNDGSTDDSVRKVKEIIDPRIRLYSQPNAGVSAARNRGIVEARGDYLAFLDADDEWKEDYLKSIWTLHVIFPIAKVMATSCEYITSEKIYPLLFDLPEWSLLSLADYIDCCVKKASLLWTSAIVVAKELIQEVGCFQEGQNHGEDLDVWFRLMERSLLAFYNRPMAKYWIGLPNSLTNKKSPVEDKPLLRSLEIRLAKGDFQDLQRQAIIDYIAWRNLLAFQVCLSRGNQRQALGLMRASWKSKTLRSKFMVAIIKSIVPHKIMSFLREIKAQVIFSMEKEHLH